MQSPALRRRAGAASILALLSVAFAGAVGPGAAAAQGLFSQPKYAAVVEDANTGEVLYAMRADALRHPASLTKIMTLYLTFEALSTGRLRMGDVITISPHAFSMAPSKVSSHAGETLSVAEAIPAMTVHSANDVAVAMAERIGGSESAFAQLMTSRARELGMTETNFANASGLPPDGQQISSAHDMAILARAVMRDYPQYYHFFGLKSIDYHGKTLMNHNHLVAKMPGVDGMKTGYTSLAGFNLVASGVRDGHRLITVVLGGPSVAARDENVEELLDAGFTVLKDRALGHPMRLASLISSPDDMSGPVSRPPVEEGSADQSNLRVELEPVTRTLPMAAAAAALDEQPATAAPQIAAAPASDQDCAPTRRSRRHRRHASAACQLAMDARKPAAPVAKAQVATVPPPCASHHRHRHAACNSAGQDAAAPVQTAKADADKPDKALAAKVQTDKGGYMIQVGAYKNRTLAKGQLDKIGPLVTGSGAVEVANGNFRARFRGMTQAQAKAACRSLSAKGQACMVMSAS